MQDPYGQVNPVYRPPVVDKMGVQPQKVSRVYTAIGGYFEAIGLDTDM